MMKQYRKILKADDALLGPVKDQDNGEKPNAFDRMKSVKIIPTTPYSVFVRSSPVYNTSRFPTKRSIRPAGRPPVKFTRHLPFRPDEYPYADARWTQRMSLNKDTERVDE
jgi:hypothetical protein